VGDREFTLKGHGVTLRVTFVSDDMGDQIQVEHLQGKDEASIIFYANFQEVELEHEQAYEDFEADEDPERGSH